jgi:hypothetical protein
MNSPGGIVKRKEDYQSEKSTIILEPVIGYLLL